MSGPEDCSDMLEVERVISDFDTYTDAQIMLAEAHKIQLERSRCFFSESLAAIISVEETNARLEVAGRPDLAIEDRVDPEKLELTKDPASTLGNFTTKFSIITRTVYTGQINSPKPVEYTTVTEDELTNLAATLPSIQTREQKRELSARYVCLTPLSNFAGTAAFLRMLVLFPEFTKGLVLECGYRLENNQENKADLQLHFYIAQYLMAHLIDSKDLNALNDDHTVNKHLLHT